ncbi:retrovirus-related pol polyprotein from transposon TNT 1-94 [Tanacetum coccineum]
MVVLTKRIDDMTKGKSEKRKKEKEKSKKCLIAESFDWDDESISPDDEGSTKIRAFMAIAEDEPSVGKTDARSGQWVDITMKKVHRLLSMIDLPGNIAKALGGKGRKKEKISSKEVVFTKADESSSVLAPEITSDLESKCDSQEPLPHIPKLIGATPSGTLESLISLSDLTLNMAGLTLDTPVPKKTTPSVKADSSTEQLLLTLMEEPKCSTYGSTDHQTKEHLEHVVVKKKLGVKYVVVLRMNHLTILRNTPTPGDQGYLKRYSKESCPKVVFVDGSLGDTEGYGSVNCNGITFTRVAYVNGLKHNLISISQLCDANYKVLFTKTQGTIYNQNDEVVIIAPIRRDVYVIDIKIENLNEVRVKELRSDNGTEFRNHKLEEFCDENGISQNFSSPCTPKQNGVTKRRNITLIEAARTMQNSAKPPKQF